MLIKLCIILHRNNILLHFVVDLCKIAVSASRYEWMGALPLLHVLKHDKFHPEQPYSLPLTEKEIESCLFCELDVHAIYNKGLKVDDRFVHYN